MAEDHRTSRVRRDLGLVAAAAVGTASAQADCKALVASSPFGPDDQTGATNRVTPAVTKAAGAEIQTGVVTPMANILVDGVPLVGTRFTKTILSTFLLTPGAELGKTKMVFMPDWPARDVLAGIVHGLQEC
jgi:hypothetical protein